MQESCDGERERPDAEPTRPRVTIEIRDPGGSPLPNGTTGEIWVKSPTIPPRGYDNRPELSRTVFRDGFYNSGDIGHKDARGHLALAGRRQSFINIGGSKVDTAEVEEVLSACPGIKEAAVVGIDDRTRGEAVYAFIVPVEGSAPDEKDLAEFLRHNLAPYKQPREIISLASLPRNAGGKILKKDLRATYLKARS